MTLFKLFEQDLESIRDAKGRIKKLEALSKISEVTKKLMTLSFDPFHNFGISKLTAVDEDPFIYASDASLIDTLVTGNPEYFKLNIGQFTDDQIEAANWVLSGFAGYGLGVTGNSFLKCFPGAFKTFELQLASGFDPKKFIPGSFSQKKIDGVRCVDIVDARGRNTCLSRNGKPIYNIDPKILEDLSAHQNFVFDGEAVVGDFALSVGAVHRSKSDSVKVGFVIFDGLTLEEFETKKCDLSYEERYDRIMKKVPQYVAEHTKVQTTKEVRVIYDSYIAQGLEGSIIKTCDGLYAFKRTEAWQKIKPTVEMTTEIVADPTTGLCYVEGSGKAKGSVGKVFVKSFDGTVSGCGGGLTDAMREYLWDNRYDLEGLIIEVLFTEISPAGRLRHPRFSKLRPDLEICDDLSKIPTLEYSEITDHYHIVKN